MNSSGRLLNALQVKEIYRRRARARLEDVGRSRAGEVETVQQRGWRGPTDGAARVARQQASWLQDGGAMRVARGGGVVSTSLLLCVELELSSRLTLVAGGRAFSAWEELRATRKSAAQQRRKVRRKAWQQQQLRAAVAVRGTGLRRGGGDGGGVCGGVCSGVCADRQQRVRVDVHSGAATGAASSRQLAAAAEARERDRDTDTESQRARERAAAGTLRFGWLNTLQSHPILTPSLRTNPCEMSVKSGRFSSLSSGRSHIVHAIWYISTA